VNRVSHLEVLQYGILYLHLYKTFVIIKVLNEILKLHFLAVRTRHKTVCYALLVTYGVSGALEQLELELSPTNKIEIINIIKLLSGNKAPGHDKVPACVIKSIAIDIVKPLACIQFIILPRSVSP